MAVFDGKKIARSIVAAYIVVNYNHAIYKSIFPWFSPKSSKCSEIHCNRSLFNRRVISSIYVKDKILSILQYKLHGVNLNWKQSLSNLRSTWSLFASKLVREPGESLTTVNNIIGRTRQTTLNLRDQSLIWPAFAGTQEQDSVAISCRV